MKRLAAISICVLVNFCLVGVVAAQQTLPPGLKVVSIEAKPQVIQLQDRFAYRQLLITGKLESGETADLTRWAQPAAQPKLVAISANGLVTPLADGSETIVLNYGEHQAEVKVEVTGATASREIDFVTDVQPVLSRLGCNQGTCHGSKDGKNGFKLSLRGYDPLYDHRSLTDDIAARRFNRAAPDQSLMLLKATGSVPHVGGALTEVRHPYYAILRQWIAKGSKLDLSAPRVTQIEVFPKNPILPRAQMSQQMQVYATYADGTVRDVTREAFVESGNLEVVTADARGLLTTLRRGEAPVLVRYEGAYAATTITVMGDRSGFVWEQPPTRGYIDELVYHKLRRVKVAPAPLCSDDEFIRRLYLHLTGLPPSAEQVKAFLADTTPSQEKRDALVDRLVGGPEYVEHWTNKWADLLQVNRKFLGEEGAAALRNWIKGAVASNEPYDEFAYQVLTATGSNINNPPAAYYKILRDPADTMENTTHLFLAVRFNCNKCHDHPFERWTQDQYYQLAAYFAQTGLKPDPRYGDRKLGGSAVEGAKPLVEVVYDRRSGEITHDRTGEVTPPAFPFEHKARIESDTTRREQVARWITAPSNPYFATSYVNRLWGYLLGVGIIEPIDDIRAGNPPTNPELLEKLTDDFIQSGFDVQHMLRTICKSRVYQHSVQTELWNADDRINYSHFLPQRLPAEVLYDSIHAATGSTLKLPGVPEGFRAAELPDAGIKVPFLDDFGRPVRESSCECERSSGMVLGPVMKLVNGPTLANAIADPNNRLVRLEQKYTDDQALLTELFLNVLNRYPTEQEIQLGAEALAQANQDHELLQAELSQYEQQLTEKQAAWEMSLRQVTHWTAVAPESAKSQVGAELAIAGEVVTVQGGQGKDVYSLTLKTSASKLTGIRLETLSDSSLPAGGPGRAKNGNFVLNEFRVKIQSLADPSQSKSIKLAKATADFSQSGWDVAGAIDGDPGTGWAIMPDFNKPHEAIFEFADQEGFEGGSLITIELDQQYPDGLHSIGKFRLSLSESPRPLGRPTLEPALAKLLATPVAERTAEQSAELQRIFREQDARWKQLTQDLARSAERMKNPRLAGLQDLTWALINTPSFLFNR